MYSSHRYSMDRVILDLAGLTILAGCLRSGHPLQPSRFAETDHEKTIRRLLDGLAILLTREPSDKAACSLHFPPENTAYITFVIARNNQIAGDDRDTLTRLLSGISDFVVKSPPQGASTSCNIGTAGHPDELALAKLIFPYCRPRLMGKAEGSKIGIEHIARIATSLYESKSTPSFNSHLAGRRFGNSQQVYNSDSVVTARTSLFQSLMSLVKIARAVNIGYHFDVESLYRLVLLANQICSDDVYLDLCDQLLTQQAKKDLLNYLEELSNYAAALRSIVAMRKSYWSIADSKRPSVRFEILHPPISRPWTRETLPGLLNKYFEVDARKIKARIKESHFNKVARQQLQEHVEMRILDRYISQPDLRPITYYIGMVEGVCVLCRKFLVNFKKREMLNGHVSIRSWDVKGESGIFDSRWLPPSTVKFTEEDEDDDYEFEDGKYQEVYDCMRGINCELINEIKRSV